LKQNKILLSTCSPKFCEIVGNIERKQFSGKQFEIAKDLNFALKTAAKMENSHKQVYIINETMQAELDFIRQALESIQEYHLKCPSCIFFQELQQLLCLETVPFKLMEDT
jgi:hypothetical protein